MIACRNAGRDPVEHFHLSVKPVPIGKGGTPREDFRLTRYACYLVALNGDPSKPEVADAQNYFVERTRQAEVIEELHALASVLA